VLQDVTTSIERALRRRRASRLAAASLGEVAVVAVGAFRTLAWELDLATLEALISGPNRAEARSLLERRFGAAFDGDLGGTSRPLIPRARMFRSEAQLDRIVLVRNLLALEDTRPGIRFVAGRWLQPRAPGLAGYDPFAPFEERRRAVDRLWQRLVPEETP
ncbi:MAG TPA: hypothetical protein VFF73_18675, partial [Planctomycetota bacterium]|nr:hypothetical protein [Planctomycetota bacterium]